MIRTFKNLLMIDKLMIPFFDVIMIGYQKIIICNLNKDDLFDLTFYNLIKYGAVSNCIIVWVTTDFELEIDVDMIITQFSENFIIFID